MNQSSINMIIGYAIIINLIGLVFIYLYTKTDFIKLSKKIFNIVVILLSLVGGFIGTIVGAEMLAYDQDSKLFKRWLPLFVFIEACILAYIIYSAS